VVLLDKQMQPDNGALVIGMIAGEASGDTWVRH